MAVFIEDKSRHSHIHIDILIYISIDITITIHLWHKELTQILVYREDRRRYRVFHTQKEVEPK